jgi:hypothetical protein
VRTKAVPELTTVTPPRPQGIAAATELRATRD